MSLSRSCAPTSVGRAVRTVARALTSARQRRALRICQTPDGEIECHTPEALGAFAGTGERLLWGLISVNRTAMQSVTHVFFDIGGVLETNGWDREQRAAVRKHFALGD